MARKTEVAEATIGKAEARKLIDEAKKGFGAVVIALRAIKERGAWLALGYASIAECVDREFSHTMKWANEQLRIAEVTQRVLAPPMGQSAEPMGSGLSRRVVEKLQKVPEDEQQGVYQTALDLAEQQGRNAPTEADLGRVIDIRKDEVEAPAEEAPAEPLCDEEGDEVPKGAQALFVDGEAWKAVRGHVAAAVKGLKALAEKPSARPQNVAALLTVLAFVSASTKRRQFHAFCPECDGKGCNYCYGWGGLLKNRFVKDADAVPSPAQLDFLGGFEKVTYELRASEVSQRLELHLAGRRLKKPTGCRPLNCPFKKKKEDFTLAADSQAEGTPLVDW